MADENKKNEDGNLIETTGRVKLNPVPLRFGGSRPPREEDRKGLPTATEARSDYEALESPHKIIRQGLLVVFLFFGILGVWAFFGTIQGAVVGSGKIKIDNERKIVQHLEGGIVEEVLVREGEEVLAGQPLIILKSVQTDANANVLRKELVTLEAQRTRFMAERDGKRDLSWSEELKTLAENAASMDVLANEEKIFASRIENLDTQVSLLNAQIKQNRAEIAGYEDQIRAENHIISTLQEELGAKRKLHRERYVDKTQILGLERDLANHQGTRGKLRQSVAQVQQRVAELNLRINEVRGRFIEDAVKNLGDMDSRIIQARERLRPLEDAAERLQIRAPVSGRVVDLKVHTNGSVVRAGETLMDIVPHDNPMIVETQVPVNKITEVYVGQPAMVQLDAFDTRLVPQMPGHVSYISADSLESPHGDTYYLCHVEVDPKGLEEERLYLSPGMPATVFITTTERTIVYYMFEPYIKNWERALRD